MLDGRHVCVLVCLHVCMYMFVFLYVCVYVCFCECMFVLYTSSFLLYYSTLDHAFQWIIATKNRLIEEHRSKSIDTYVQDSLVRCSSGGGDVLTLSVTKELDGKLRDVRLDYRIMQSDVKYRSPSVFN